MKKTVTVVKSLPENLVGDEIFIVKCNEALPGKHLHSLINDGRSYGRNPTTNKALSSLFSSDNKVNIFKYSCTGSA